MSEGHRFKVGERVRPSQYGIDCNIFPKTRVLQTGIVVRVDEFNDPVVRWRGRTTPKGYAGEFIAPDRRRRWPA